MRIHLLQSGGVAGLTLRATAEAEELSPAEVNALRALTREGASRKNRTPSGADRYQYDLDVEDGSSRSHLTLQEDEVPADLQPIIGRLSQRALPA